MPYISSSCHHYSIHHFLSFKSLSKRHSKTFVIIADMALYNIRMLSNDASKPVIINAIYQTLRLITSSVSTLYKNKIFSTKSATYVNWILCLETK
jgi:hypothetical protein